MKRKRPLTPTTRIASAGLGAVVGLTSLQVAAAPDDPHTVEAPSDDEPVPTAREWTPQDERKRRAWIYTAISGVGLVAIGGALTIAGRVMVSRGPQKLDDLREDSGELPVDSKERVHAIRTTRAGFASTYVGIGVIVVGAVLAGVGGAKARKLRKLKSQMAWGIAPSRQGAHVSLGVRF